MLKPSPRELELVAEIRGIKDYKSMSQDYQVLLKNQKNY